MFNFFLDLLELFGVPFGTNQSLSPLNAHSGISDPASYTIFLGSARISIVGGLTPLPLPALSRPGSKHTAGSEIPLRLFGGAYTTKQPTSTPECGATLQQVLEIAGLLKAYEEFICLFTEAELLFVQNNPRAALNIFYKIWMSPHFVPALLLYECYYARELFLPDWNVTGKHHLVHMLKKSGGTRPIIIPKKRTHICMGVVNTLLQSTCKSWSMRSTGFRPGYGTHDAVNLLANSALNIMHTHGKVFILSFDIQKAFNSVDLKKVFKTLGLKALPHDIKNLIWKWQHSPVVYGDESDSKLLKRQLIPVLGEARSSMPDHSNSLIQGFSYSPTLFAWYLDVILVQHCSLIAYADNFAGVYTSSHEAEQAVLNASALLKAHGLSINEKSISIYVRSFNSVPSLYPWLGHALSLPDCNVVLNKFQQKAPVSEPVFISLEKWHSMLQNSNWVQKVHNLSWCHNN